MLKADGLDGAIIGTVERADFGTVLLYDSQRCIQLLAERDGLDIDGAREWFYYNVAGAYVGPDTPCFAELGSHEGGD